MQAAVEILLNDAVYEMCGKKNFSNMERDISAWSAEHPEPVYPKWGEWLAERGELSENWKKIQVVSHDSICGMMLEWFNNPIPADIAQKLGIEPKEG